MGFDLHAFLLPQSSWLSKCAHTCSNQNAQDYFNINCWLAASQQCRPARYTVNGRVRKHIREPGLTAMFSFKTDSIKIEKNAQLSFYLISIETIYRTFKWVHQVCLMFSKKMALNLISRCVYL